MRTRQARVQMLARRQSSPGGTLLTPISVWMVYWRCKDRFPSFTGPDVELRAVVSPKRTLEAYLSFGCHEGPLLPSTSVGLASTAVAVVAGTAVGSTGNFGHRRGSRLFLAC